MKGEDGNVVREAGLAVKGVSSWLPVAAPGPRCKTDGRTSAELASCYGEASQRHQGQTIYGAASPDTHDADAPELLLEVQYTGGVLRVAEAPVKTRGGASDETLACLQAQLRNLEVKVRAPSKYDRLLPQCAPQPP